MRQDQQGDFYGNILLCLTVNCILYKTCAQNIYKSHILLKLQNKSMVHRSCQCSWSPMNDFLESLTFLLPSPSQTFPMLAL